MSIFHQHPLNTVTYPVTAQIKEAILELVPTELNPELGRKYIKAVNSDVCWIPIYLNGNHETTILASFNLMFSDGLQPYPFGFMVERVGDVTPIYESRQVARETCLKNSLAAAKPDMTEFNYWCARFIQGFKLSVDDLEEYDKVGWPPTLTAKLAHVAHWILAGKDELCVSPITTLKLMGFNDPEEVGYFWQDYVMGDLAPESPLMQVFERAKVEVSYEVLPQEEGCLEVTKFDVKHTQAN
jgi:hypothetical protein